MNVGALGDDRMMGSRAVENRVGTEMREWI